MDFLHHLARVFLNSALLLPTQSLQRSAPLLIPQAITRALS